MLMLLLLLVLRAPVHRGCHRILYNRQCVYTAVLALLLRSLPLCTCFEAQ